MWNTPEGLRVITGDFWNLLRHGIECLSFSVLEREYFQDPGGDTEVMVFDQKLPAQQLALLHDVCELLRIESAYPINENACMEGTVAAILSEITTRIAMEIDSEKEADNPDPFQFRRLVRQACFSEPIDRKSIPEISSRSLDEWESAIVDLHDCLLWDQDYELEASLSDDPPAVANAQRTLLGIEADYTNFIPREPNRRELEEIRISLSKMIELELPNFRRN
jgi:hypothetical protein